MHWLSFIRANAEWLHILSSVVTVVSLFVALYLFKAQIEIQSRERRVDELAQVAALRVELSEITWTMNRYIGLTTTDLTMIFEHFLPIENLREATRTGWLASGELGPEIIRIYQLVKRENTKLALENSPEFLLTDPAGWKDRKSKATQQRIQKLPALKAQVLALDQHLASLQQMMAPKVGGEQPFQTYVVPAAAQP